MLRMNGLTVVGLLKISLHNLRINWIRSALTVLGMVFGTGAVIATLSSNEGAKTFVQKELAKLGTNILTFTGAPNAPAFNSDDAAALTRYSDVIASAVLVTNVTGVAVSHRAVAARPEGIIGVEPGFFEAMRLQLSAGRLPNELERREARLVVVLGRKVAKALLGDVSPVGAHVELSAGPSRFVAKVIGVTAEKGVASGIDFDSMMYLPTSAARLLSAGKPRISMLATLKSEQETLRAKNQAQAVLASRFPPNSVKIFDAREAIERTNAIWEKQNLVGIALASVCLLTGGVGIMNVMTLSVLHRKREVGLRKAIGATDTAISSQFLLEAVFICFVGGIAGVLTGWGFGRQVAKMLGDWEATMSIQAVVLALGFATFVGIFFGLYPAIRASKMAPYDALRG